MKKVYLKNQLKGYPIEVISNVLDVINVLGENYGANRDIEKDLGGYIVIAENIVVIEMLKKDKLQGLIPEYTDIIECKEGVNWTSSLFLLSSDYAITSKQSKTAFLIFGYLIFSILIPYVTYMLLAPRNRCPSNICLTGKPVLRSRLARLLRSKNRDKRRCPVEAVVSRNFLS